MSAAQTERPRLHQRTLVVLLCWTLGGGAGMGWLAVGLLSLWPIVVTVFLHDAPFAELGAYAWIAKGSLLATPALCLVSALSTPVAIVLGRVMQRKGRVKLGWLVVLMAPPLAALPLLALAGVAFGYGMLQLS